jgi:ElaB/YqjD/DUF883 family membrane-anchored ribosome-binding protein
MGDFESAVSARFGDYPPRCPIQEAFASHMVFRPDRNFPPDYLMEETLSCRVRVVTVRMEQIPAWWVDFRISNHFDRLRRQLHRRSAAKMAGTGKSTARPALLNIRREILNSRASQQCLIEFTSNTTREFVFMVAADKDLADHLQTIRSDISSLMQAVSQLASETGGIHKSLRQSLGDAAKDAVDAGDWLLGEAGRFGGEAVHVAERGAIAAVSEVQEQIERNPFTAVLIALGFGLVIGLFGGARSRPAPITAASRRRLRRS